MVWLAVVVLLVFLFSLGYDLGRRKGRVQERVRVEHLFYESAAYRSSATTRWIWNAVHDGQAQLTPPEKFFGPDWKEKT